MILDSLFLFFLVKTWSLTLNTYYSTTIETVFLCGYFNILMETHLTEFSTFCFSLKSCRIKKTEKNNYYYLWGQHHASKLAPLAWPLETIETKRECWCRCILRGTPHCGVHSLSRLTSTSNHNNVYSRKWWYSGNLIPDRRLLGLTCSIIPFQRCSNSYPKCLKLNCLGSIPPHSGMQFTLLCSWLTVNN